MEKKVINQFYHEHPLIFIENVSDEVSSNCYGCGDPVTNLESAYVCTQQKNCENRIVLHKKCGELPIQVLHPKHPQHPLHLFDYHGTRYRWWCNVCLHDLKPVLAYRCSICDFDVDIKCEKISIDMILEENRQIEHPSHSDHPLTLMRKPSFLFSCDGCGVEDVDMAYICSTCEVWIHKSCASLPLILPLNRQYHHHPLSLAFSFPSKYRKYIIDCDVCLKRLNKTSWVYFCGICRFFAHIRCVVASTTGDSNLRDDEDDDGLNVIEFPLHAHDISKELITPLVMREKGLNNIPDVADMPAIVKMPETTASFSFLFNYHKHPLSLVSELSHKDNEVDHNKMVDRDEDDEYDELKVCDVCVTPIFSPPYYECAPCKYFVHSICYLLPKTLSSSPPVLYDDCPKTHDKNHKFSLFTSSRSVDMDPDICRCEACGILTNGMMYECEGCEMTIDVKCASLPTTIRHTSHPHCTPLVLTRIPPAGEEEAGKRRGCHACRYYMDNCIAYCCSSNDCKFALDLDCAMLPASITMREWDKHHSLMLSFDASLDHPSDFICDFCEKELHPKRWMYHCRQCDLSFHLYCLKAASGGYRSIKFGRRFLLDGIHPNHALTFNHITIKRRCDLCHVNVYNYCGLECASCYYVVCLVCASEELSEMKVIAT